MSIILGCIADDFTGGTDLANTLVKQGMRTVQLNGIPQKDWDISDTDAIIISLKCRSIQASDAVEQCLRALSWLRKQGCQQFFWKCSSTFDSTSEGNIGPVAEALQNALGSSASIVCPAFPENKRTIYNGHLFVGDVLLSESGMRNHPVTPMRDSNLKRLLKAQIKGDVALLKLETIQKGVDSIRKAFSDFAKQKISLVVADAVNNADLMALGEACFEMPLITGASGIALGLPSNYRREGLIPEISHAEHFMEIEGITAILSGSCSEATIKQIHNFKKHNFPMFKLDPIKLSKSPEYLKEVFRWAKEQIAEKSFLIYSSAAPDAISVVQESLGKTNAATMIENAFAAIAKKMACEGIHRFIVAGGETSGAIVEALGIPGMYIGPQIAPGVPWTFSIGKNPIALSLKSGNFGEPDFFMDALRMLS